jgi:hypothetical protein
MIVYFGNIPSFVLISRDQARTNSDRGYPSHKEGESQVLIQATGD